VKLYFSLSKISFEPIPLEEEDEDDEILPRWQLSAARNSLFSATKSIPKIAQSLIPSPELQLKIPSDVAVFREQRRAKNVEWKNRARATIRIAKAR
jgi:hypothetical protein